MSNKQQLPMTVHFVIKRKALLYDIENYAYILGNPISEDAQPAKHQLIDVGQEGNIDVVTRLLDLAYSECQSILFPHIIEQEHSEYYGNDMLQEVSEYEFALQMPADYPSSSIFHLKKLIHELMVCKAMVIWLGLNNSPTKVEWEVRYEETKDKMRQTLTFRRKKLRRKLHPF